MKSNGPASLLTAAFLLLNAPLLHSAPPCAPEARKPDDPYVFINAFIDALALANTAVGRFTPTDPAAAAKLEELGELMFQTKQASQEYQCAADTVEPFLNSTYEVIRLPALVAHGVYKGQVDINEELLAELRSSLYKDYPLETFLDRVTDLRVKRAAMWKLLFRATVPAAHALVKMPDDTKAHLSHLAITDQQRASIMKKLEQLFGSDVKEGAKPGLSSLDGSAATLYTFVADRGWKSAESH